MKLIKIFKNKAQPAIPIYARNYEHGIGGTGAPADTFNGGAILYAGRRRGGRLAGRRQCRIITGHIYIYIYG